MIPDICALNHPARLKGLTSFFGLKSPPEKKELVYLGFPGGSEVKNPPANAGDAWFKPLSWEDPLEKGAVTHSSILAWETPWTEEPGGLQSKGSQGVGHD